jgi:hypothetical protein
MEEKYGGRHGGTYNTLSSQTDSQLLRSIRSFSRNIDEHYKKIANPGDYSEKWAAGDDDYRNGLLKKWNGDIKRNAEQLSIAKGIAKERGILDEQ